MTSFTVLKLKNNFNCALNRSLSNLLFWNVQSSNWVVQSSVENMAESHKLRLIFYLINNWNIGFLKTWSNFRISITGSKDRMILCRIRKQHHKKVMLRSFNLNRKNFRISSSDSKDRAILSTHTIQKCLKSFSSLNSVSGEYLTIIPRARMGYWLRGHKGDRNNCFSKIQPVGQNIETKQLQLVKARR